MTGARADLRQQAFADHLRDPDRHAAPAGMDPARVALYRDLFFNNVEGLLAGFFPVLRSLYTDGDWRALARAFYAHHRARTPYFLELADEFVDYLASAHAPRAADPPFLHALAHYEWLELVLDVADETIPATGIDADGDLRGGVPVLNPLAVLARYDWPVHRVAASNPRPPPATTWLLVWRDRADRVRFQELNELSALLFTRLRENAGVAGDRVVRALVDPSAADAGGHVVDAAQALLASWRARDVLLGTRVC